MGQMKWAAGYSLFINASAFGSFIVRQYPNENSTSFLKKQEMNESSIRPAAAVRHQQEQQNKMG
jgi:hypothetical protein